MREFEFGAGLCRAHGEFIGQYDAMPGLKLHTSNQLEKLIGRLAGVLEKPAGAPLAPDVIVVQSRGMARWVSLQIARETGICMNCDFPFPRAFVDRTLRLFFPEMAGSDEFSADVMAWKIHAMLPALVKRREFAQVRHYIGDDDGLKTFQLSEKIAHLFDQYLVYRPEMLLRWEREASERDWQAVLWRELTGKRPPMHLAAVGELLGERMAAKLPGDVANLLPARVSVFGISSLPPLYMRVFFEMARHCEVHLFSLQPSQEYHGHDLTPKQRAKMAGRGVGFSADELPAGNPLLASMGRLNRDFVEVRLETDEHAGIITEDQPEQFIEPHGEGMLSVVQGDILHARSRGDAENPKCRVAADDRSIRVHACHSPMREVEVLYDQLLDLFNRDPSLHPRDIIVMTPDIEKYAPFIQSVFAFPEEKSRYIPHSITDRRPRSDSPLVETFLSLLDLPGSRCTATEIFSLLDRAPVRARYEFTDDDMGMIRGWIAETGIRWGVDAAHRAGFDLPELEGNTWRAGFQRLLLGLAMTGDNRMMFDGIMPFDEVEGGDPETLGRFITATEALFEMAEMLPAKRTLVEWPDAFAKVVETFFLAETPAEVADLRIIQNALEELRKVAALAGGGREVEFRAVRHYLSQLLDDTEQRGGFLTGGVTFCALKPMRSIPARVICLIGMDDQAFPRQFVAPGFDLMARERRCGDRSPRDDDRYSFLEAIVSAREHLYVSYAGHSVIDNAEIPPSVLVSELMDYLGQAFEFPGGQGARKFVTSEHRLHAFSPQYFNGCNPALFSYSGANAAASRTLQAPSQAAPAFLDQPLAPPEEEARNVDMVSLIRFFAHPAKYFVQQRLGIRLEDGDDVLEDSEPFDLGYLEAYQLKQELVAGALEKHPAKPEEYAARGVLPHGGIGEAHFNQVRRVAREFSKKVEPELRGTEPSGPLLVDLRLGEFTLTGKIGSIYAGRVVRFRCAKLKMQDWIAAWINHLARCAAFPGQADETVLLCENDGARFSPVANAEELLGGLLSLYWQGLVRPLPFFPRSAFAYSIAEIRPSERAKSSPLSKARTEWHGSEYSGTGEKRDPYMEFCFGDVDTLDDSFTRLALEVFEPLLRNSTPLE